MKYLLRKQFWLLVCKNISLIDIQENAFTYPKVCQKVTLEIGDKTSPPLRWIGDKVSTCYREFWDNVDGSWRFSCFIVGRNVNSIVSHGDVNKNFSVFERDVICWVAATVGYSFHINKISKDILALCYLAREKTLLFHKCCYVLCRKSRGI